MFYLVSAVERNDDEENGTTPINLRLSKYLAVNEIKSSDNIRILSFNAQSINNKFQKMRDITQHIEPIAMAGCSNRLRQPSGEKLKKNLVGLK